MDLLSISFLLHDTVLRAPTHLDSSVSFLSGKKATKVAVIRVFGYSRPGSEIIQCCLNIHGYFPRLYIDEIPGYDALGLCELLDLKLGGETVVYNISRESRVNFYGYHSHASTVLCVEVFRPVDVSRIAEFLSMAFPLCLVYEVHIPYLLNFLIDAGIQAITPFQIDISRAVFTRTTTCELEYSIPFDAIVLASQQSQISLKLPYPVPPPLANTMDDHQLVCTTLQSLWEEEYQSLQPGDPFPYFPEGIVDGLNRPDCSEMTHIVHATNSASTQELAEGLANLPTSAQTHTYEQSTHTYEQQSTHTYVQSGHIQTTGDTQVWEPANASNTLPDAHAQVFEPETFSDMPAVPLDRQDAISELPNGPCLLRYRPPPLPSSVNMHATAVSQPVDHVPLRMRDKIALTLEECVEVLSFGKMCVVEILHGDDCGVLAIVCICIDQSVLVEYEEFVFHTSTDVHTNFVHSTEEQHLHKNFAHSTETDMLHAFSEFMRKFDPAVIVSWDATRETVGVLIERGVGLGRCLLEESTVTANARHYSGHRGSHVNVPGRLILDLWKILRKDVDLRLGTTVFEGVVECVLGETIPCISPTELHSMWFTQAESVLGHLVRKTRMCYKLVLKTRIMEKSTEMARLLGMDLESAFIRGSQFRVECILVRAARKSGYVLPSSTRIQVKNQRLQTGLPLILDPPGAGILTDPVCVMDFQSLYPSVIIAYNICYSTCLGKSTDLEKVAKLGTHTIERNPQDVANAIVVPGDVLYVQRSQRVGLLPRICHEILQTRIMVKKSMKSGRKSEAKLGQLDARQQTLKLLSNVVYGYTTASFTGRMPCSEIGDSILLTARATLEATMNFVTGGPTVVYGDTDSLFVKQELGKTVQETFDWGEYFVEECTNQNPWPIKLVLEKVYFPCCLMTKKRYVGKAYDSANGEPRIDAKGIETIRRDTCPAVAVTLERIVNTVFSDPNEATLQKACIDEFMRILCGKIPLRFFVFQNQVRDVEYYKDPQNLPPAAKVAADQGIETVRGDRIAYVITQGLIGSKLSEQVHPPQALIETNERKRMTLNIDYYLTKQVVPAIQRIFGSMANPAVAWLQLAKGLKSNDIEDIAPTILDVAQKKNCILCKSVTASSIFRNAHVPLFCAHCATHREPLCIYTINAQVSKLEKKCSDIRKLCLNCSCGTNVEACRDALYCNIYFERETAKLKLIKAYQRRTELDLFKNHFHN